MGAAVQRDPNLQSVLFHLLGQVTLEFISIRTAANVIPQTQNVLEKVQFKRRKRLKVQIVIVAYNQNNPITEHTMSKFRNFMKIRLQYKLINSVTDDWMLLFKIVGSPSRIEINHNDNCSINGYSERWLHPCVCQRSLTK